MTTTVLDSEALAAAAATGAAGCTPATCRIGLLGLGNVGSAFARHTRIWTTRVARRGDRTYVLTCSASHGRVQSALDALQATLQQPLGTAAAFPAVLEEAAC